MYSAQFNILNYKRVSFIKTNLFRGLEVLIQGRDKLGKTKQKCCQPKDPFDPPNFGTRAAGIGAWELALVENKVGFIDRY